MSATAPELSVILPVYRGASVIARTIAAIRDTLDPVCDDYEIIVVSDGDGEETLAAACASAFPGLTVIDIPVNQGKGRAVVTGMAYSRGDYVGFFDADLDIDPIVIPVALDLLKCERLDAVVGSKRHADSDVRYSPMRRVYSWGFQQLVSMLFRVQTRDTQVGAKFFRRDVALDVAPLLEVDGYAFDIEFLAVASRRGHGRINEAPVRIAQTFAGSGINIGQVWRMFADTIGVAHRVHLQHRYDDPVTSQPLTAHRIAMREGVRVSGAGAQ